MTHRKLLHEYLSGSRKNVPLIPKTVEEERNEEAEWEREHRITRSAEFVSVLPKNRSGRKALSGVSLSWAGMSNKPRFRLHIGQDVLKRSGLAKGVLVDVQIDIGRKLLRIVPVDSQHGHSLHDQGASVAIQFFADEDYVSALKVETPTKLDVIKASGAQVVCRLPETPAWRSVTTE